MAGEELILAAVLAIILVLVILRAAIKVVREYERLVIFRLGRLFPTPKGPGLTVIIPIFDRRVLIDLRDRLGGGVPRTVATAAVRRLAGLSDFLPSLLPYPDGFLRRIPVVRDVQGAANPAPRSDCWDDDWATRDRGRGPPPRGEGLRAAPRGALAGDGGRDPLGRVQSLHPRG